jgi:hypothetical protein
MSAALVFADLLAAGVGLFAFAGAVLQTLGAAGWAFRTDEATFDAWLVRTGRNPLVDCLVGAAKAWAVAAVCAAWGVARWVAA